MWGTWCVWWSCDSHSCPLSQPGKSPSQQGRKRTGVIALQHRVPTQKLRRGQGHEDGGLPTRGCLFRNPREAHSALG